MKRTTDPGSITDCEDLLNEFFGSNRDDSQRKRSLKALRFLVASNEPLSGKPAGWAGGIVYALANRDRRACGVPGLLNQDLAVFFGVSMATIRKRAVQVASLLTI